MRTLRDTAPAKINLYLHITGRRTDGYHLLDSLVAFADISDLVYARPAPDLSLRLSGPTAAGVTAQDDNLVLRAARTLAAWAERPAGAALVLEKHLPVAAGIGGGSADAAATLRLLCRLWGLTPPTGVLAKLALGLGADVPVCLAGQPAHMAGIGADLSPCPALPPLWVVLVNPGIALSTPAVFAARPAGRFRPPAPLTDMPATPAALIAALAQRHNDLEAPARRLVPAIDRCLAGLRAQPGCGLARLSGSGATCFGLFDTAAAARTAVAALAQPGWWVRAGRLLGSEGGA